MKGGIDRDTFGDHCPSSRPHKCHMRVKTMACHYYEQKISGNIVEDLEFQIST